MRGCRSIAAALSAVWPREKSSLGEGGYRTDHAGDIALYPANEMFGEAQEEREGIL